MLLLSLIAISLLALSAVLVVRAIALPKLKAAERVRSIEAYGFKAATPDVPRIDGPAFVGLASRIGMSLASTFTGLHPESLRRELVAAGYYRLTPASLLGYRAIGATVLAVMGLLVSTGAPLPLTVLYIVGGAGFGWYMPLFFVRRAATRRLAKVDRELPDVIDMVVVTVEAGTGLAASLQLAANKNAGPLGDELRLTLQEQRMGRSLHDALLGMLGRCDTPNMRAFVRSVAQGERLGVSIGTIMRNLAVEMRKARRANAEAQAQKAPVKILFPLVFLIMPAFLISILGPPLFQFTSTI
jgi:tight adherence protein C